MDQLTIALAALRQIADWKLQHNTCADNLMKAIAEDALDEIMILQNNKA